MKIELLATLSVERTFLSRKFDRLELSGPRLFPFVSERMYQVVSTAAPSGWTDATSRREADLGRENSAQVSLSASSTINQADLLFQHFTQMVRQRRGEELEQWLQAAFHCGIPELRSFVNKLCQDQAAVQASLVLKWNNEVIETVK